MTQRSHSKRQMLQAAGWENCQFSPIAGDASSRKYQRLTDYDAGRSAILMDAPVDTAGSMVPFVQIANYLKDTGLSAPEIYAQDLTLGYLLLEDLSDNLFATVIAKNSKQEGPLYEAAIDVICHIHDHPNPALPRYDAFVMAQATDLAFLHYRDIQAETLDDHAQDVIAILRAELLEYDDYDKVSLRDFHAENLIWCAQKTGLKKVGLLDFQDAVQTHPAYDLMSLLRDARRDVSPDLVEHMITRFCQIRGYHEDDFRQQAALISAQRGLRILGIFARLSRQMGKPHYVDLIPRVWANLLTDLSHPALGVLRKEILSIVPAPTPDFLNKLRTA